MILNDPGLFYDDDEGYGSDGGFEYLEEGEEAAEDVVSTEGCFACKMNGGGGRRRRIMAGGRRHRRKTTRARMR